LPLSEEDWLAFNEKGAAPHLSRLISELYQLIQLKPRVVVYGVVELRTKGVSIGVDFPIYLPNINKLGPIAGVFASLTAFEDDVVLICLEGERSPVDNFSSECHFRELFTNELSSDYLLHDVLVVFYDRLVEGAEVFLAESHVIVERVVH